MIGHALHYLIATLYGDPIDRSLVVRFGQGIVIAKAQSFIARMDRENLTSLMHCLPENEVQPKSEQHGKKRAATQSIEDLWSSWKESQAWNGLSSLSHWFWETRPDELAMDQPAVYRTLARHLKEHPSDKITASRVLRRKEWKEGIEIFYVASDDVANALSQDIWRSIEIPPPVVRERKASKSVARNQETIVRDLKDNSVVLSVRLGDRQKSIVCTNDATMLDYLNFLTYIRCCFFLAKHNTARIHAEGAISVYQMIRERLPFEYNKALPTIRRLHERISGSLCTHGGKVVRWCSVESQQQGSHIVDFFQADDFNRNFLGNIASEHAYLADRSLSIYRWFLYLPRGSDITNEPLGHVQLVRFGIRVEPQIFERGVDQWSTMCQSGAFAVKTSALTGPIVCRIDHISDDLLLPRGSFNVPDELSELMALLELCASQYRYVSKPEVGAVEKAVSDLRSSRDHTAQLSLCLNVPVFHPGYTFRLSCNYQVTGLTPEARKSCKDYLEGLANIRMHYPN